HIRRVLGRDNEAEMMPVILAALGEGTYVHVVAFRAEHPRLFVLLPIAHFVRGTGHAIAAQVIEVRAERSRAHRMANHAGLDDDDARTSGEKPVGLDAGALTAPEARAVARGDLAGARDASAG